MAEYKLEVTTGNMTNAGTFDRIYVTLIGTGEESERTELDNFGVDFKTGMVSSYKMCVTLMHIFLIIISVQ